MKKKFKADPIKKLCRILEREFRRQIKPKHVVRVSAAIAGECIYVIYDNVIYLMEIGSDDDEFVFEMVDGQPNAGPFPVWVRFPIPDDYINTGGAIPSDYRGLHE